MYEMMVGREAGMISRCEDDKNKTELIEEKMLSLMKALTLDGEDTRCLRSKRTWKVMSNSRRSRKRARWKKA